MTFKNTITTATFITLLAAGGAIAKGHDQSGGADGEPGANAGAETAAPAQGLGSALGNGTDQSGKERGKSANAGKPDKD